MSMTKVEAALGMVQAMADAIKELGSVPSGHLYARVMGHMSLENYTAIIGVLIKAGLVEMDSSHLLRWVG